MVTVTGTNAMVSIPLDPAQSIVLAGRGRSGSVDPQPLEISVAGAQVWSAGDQADDGTVVFAGETSDLAIQALSNGAVRMQTIIEDAAPTHEYQYSFGDDVWPVLMADGTVELHREVAGGVRMVVGIVDAPWAVDSEGMVVETHYEVSGQSLVQVVEPAADASFPVIADPMVTRTWWNTTVYFNRSESLMIASGASGVAAAAALIPEPTVSKAVAAAAGLAAAYAGLINASGSCIKFVYYAHIANIWQPYGGSEAGGYCR